MFKNNLLKKKLKIVLNIKNYEMTSYKDVLP